MTKLVSGDVQTLRAHSSHLNDVADGFGECLSAAETVSAENNEDAYGILCSPLIAPPIIMVEAEAKATLAEAINLLRTLSQAVAGLANEYDDTDQANADDLDGTGDDFATPEFGDDGIYANPPGSSDGTVTA